MRKQLLVITAGVLVGLGIIIIMVSHVRMSLREVIVQEDLQANLSEELQLVTTHFLEYLNRRDEDKHEINKDLNVAKKTLSTFLMSTQGKRSQASSSQIKKVIISIENLQHDIALDNKVSESFMQVKTSIYSLEEQLNRDQREVNIQLRNWLTAILVVIILFIAIGITIWFVRSKRRRKKEQEDLEAISMKEHDARMTYGLVESISKEDYDSVQDVKSDDPLNQMLIALRGQLRTSSIANQQRHWSNVGLAKFADILGNHEDLSSLCDVLISELVNYLEVNQGGLFVKDEPEGEEVMQLQSAYAFQRKKHVQGKLYKGDGLVGQCWVEGEIILLKEIPEDYIHITSGLGGALPSTILIVPLKTNDEVFGVLELASFNDIPAYYIDFVEKVCERIAAVISNLKTNDFTKKLLEETKMQTEVLQAQEEEMRQNMEELQATQEEMERVASEMGEQIKVINSTIATIEFDLKGVIQDANDNFLRLMQYQKNEIVGRHHRIFVTAADADSEEYHAFWKKLSQGNSFEGEFRRITKGGNRVWIKGMYSPIYDKNGQLIKVVKFAYNITTEKEQRQEMSRVAKEVSEQLRIINSTVATIEFDLSGHIRYANDNFLSLMGYNMQEIMGKHHKIFVKKEDVESDHYWDCWRKLGEGESIQGEFERINKGGQKVWIKGIYSTVFDKKGRPLKVIKLAYDITKERLQQLQVAQVSKEMSQQLSIINATLATIEFDLKGNIISANDKFLVMMGYALDEVVGKHHRIFVEKEEASLPAYKKFWKQLALGANLEGEYKRLNKAGKPIWLKGIYSCVTDEKGNPVKVVKYAYNITDIMEKAQNMADLKSIGNIKMNRN